MASSIYGDGPMVKVKNIKWISNSAKEAELIITDGVNECLVFSQPCIVRIGEEISEPLKTLDTENLMKITDTSHHEKIEKIVESYFAYHCVAKVIDCNKGIVQIGKLKIELNQRIPAWANKGDLVEFDCSRLDLW